MSSLSVNAVAATVAGALPPPGFRTYAWMLMNSYQIAQGPILFYARSKRALVQYWIEGGKKPPPYSDLSGVIGEDIDPSSLTIEQFMDIIDGKDEGKMKWTESAYRVEFFEIDTSKAVLAIPQHPIE